MCCSYSMEWVHHVIRLYGQKHVGKIVWIPPDEFLIRYVIILDDPFCTIGNMKLYFAINLFEPPNSFFIIA